MNSEQSLQASIKAQRGHILKEMEEHLIEFINGMALSQDFTMDFPHHLQQKLFDFLYKELELNGFCVYEKGDAEQPFGKFIFLELTKKIGHIAIVTRLIDEPSIYKDIYGSNDVEQKIDYSFQNILSASVYLNCAHHLRGYYIIPPSTIREIKRRLEHRYVSSCNGIREQGYRITQEDIHAEVVAFFEEVLHQDARETSEEWIVKRRKELIEELYQLEQLQSSFVK